MCSVLRLRDEVLLDACHLLGDLAGHRGHVVREGRVDVGDGFERPLEGRPGFLRGSQRIDQDDGVVRAERLTVPRAPAAVLDRLLHEELTAVPFARSLDPHTRSSWGATPLRSNSSHSRYATSNGSGGFTNHASAPDHRA